MLNLILKTFLVSILSGSLLMIDFSYKGIILNELRAEKFKTDEIKDENMMASLTMTTIGLIASRLYKYKMTTDIMIAAGGGAAFIGGEIAAFSKNKEVVKGLELEIERDKHGRVNENQREMFEKHKKSYEKMKESANTKKMLQMAGAGAFAAAAAAAYFMASNESMKQAQCSMAIDVALTTGKEAVQATCTGLHTKATSEQTQCSSCSGSCSACIQFPKTLAEATKCDQELAACTAKIQNDKGTLGSIIGIREPQSPSTPSGPQSITQEVKLGVEVPNSATVCGTYAAPMAKTEATGDCPGMSTLFQTQTSFGNTGAFDFIGESIPVLPFQNSKYSFEKNKIHQNYFFNKLFSILISDAKADLFSPMGIASGLAIKFILSTNKELALQLDMLMIKPQKRAIIWGVLAGLAFAASTATGEEIAKIDENIKKIDDILSQMGAQEGIETTNIASSSSKEIRKSTTAKTFNNAIKFTSENGNIGEIEYPEKGGRFPCVTGPDSKTCPSYDATLKSLPDYQGLSDSVKVDITSVSQMVEGLNGTSKISTASLNAAQELANKANALKNGMKAKQDNFQNQLDKTKSNLNLKAESNNLKNNLLASTKKHLDSNKMSAGQMVASMKGSGINLNSIPDVKKDKNVKKDINANLNLYTTGKDKSLSDDDWGNKKDGKADSEMGDGSGYAYGGGERSKGTGDDSGTVGFAPGTVDEYDKRKDIVKDRNASLFDVITRRYQQSGYPRLFKKIK